MNLLSIRRFFSKRVLRRNSDPKNPKGRLKYLRYSSIMKKQLLKRKGLGMILQILSQEKPQRFLLLMKIDNRSY
jgi:hypothetical protein